MKARLLLGSLGLVVITIGCSQTDPGITASVKTHLAADELVRARQIDVDTKDRVVTLTGVVDTAAQEAKALEIARNTKGVADVVDNITLQSERGAEPTTGEYKPSSPVPPEAAVTDASITASVKARFLAEPAVSGLRIDVDTRDGIVTLTGTVNSDAERARAVDLARRVEHVVRVEDKLTISVR